MMRCDFVIFYFVFVGLLLLSFETEQEICSSGISATGLNKDSQFDYQLNTETVYFNHRNIFQNKAEPVWLSSP